MFLITRPNTQKIRSLKRLAQWHFATDGGLYLLLIAFVAAASLYALRIPLFETAGEPWHWRRVQTTFGGKLPEGLATLASMPTALEADAQPPLYYWLGAALTRSLPVAQDEAEYRLNPYVSLANTDPTGNKNAFLVRIPARPDGPLTKALWRLRLLSIGFATASLLPLYRLFLRLTHRNIPLSVGALSAVAFLPGYLLMASTISNAAMGFFFLILSTAITLHLVEAPAPSTLERWGAALAASVAVLVSWWGWLAVVLTVWALTNNARDRNQQRARALLSLPFLLMAAASLAWPLWRFALHPWGNVHMVWHAVQELAWGKRALLAIKAFLGIFGWLNIPVTNAHYTAAAALALLSVSGLIMSAIQARWKRQKLTFSMPWPGLILAYSAGGLLLFIATTLAPNVLYIGYALAPLTPPLALLMATGLRQWLNRDYGRVMAILPIILMLLISIGAPRMYIEPSYAVSAPLDLDHLPTNLRDLDVSFGSDLYLLGYQLDDRGLEPGKILNIKLYWLARRRMSTDYSMHVTLLGFNDALVGDYMGYIGEIRPTSTWLPGDVIIHPIAIRVAPNAEAPTAIDVRLSVYADSSQEAIAALDPQGNSLGGNFVIAQARLAAPYRVRYIPENPIEVNLDNQVSLVGYGFSPALPVPGETWKIILYWRSEGPLIRDYTVFIHLVDSNGDMVAQVDGPPLNGNYPTSLWGMGEYIRDVHYMAIPSPLISGEYRLRVGLYDLETGQRLTILDSDPPQDYISLGPINIP